MDPSRRTPRAVIDPVPKFRQVGFFAPPERSRSGPPDPTRPSPQVHYFSPSANSPSPVMIPPPRHLSDNLLLHVRPAASPLRSDSADGSSFDAADFFPAPPSPAPSSSYSSRIAGEGGFFNGAGRGKGNGAGKVAASSSFPRGGFDLTAMKASAVPASGLTTVSVVNDSLGIPEKEKGNKGGGTAVEVKDQATSSKQQKPKTSKAERRALQEAQRAAKAAAKAEGNKASGTAASMSAKSAKAVKPAQKVDNAAVAAPEKKGGEIPPEKDRKKDAPQPRMQYDDKSRVEKAKRRAVVKQTEARNRVELFRHLPQYEHGSQLPDLEAKFFHLSPVHPAVYKVGLQYLTGDISGGNARCIAMLQAFHEAVKDYKVPHEKTLVRDLTAKISSYVSFLIECRPLSISMGNAIRFLKVG
ncbi:Translation initiation factor eIF-2B subunit delta [Spatholobus suberectus]|nr:Translation initiation factor eIF-2B subunit delta [Spatholobus suberectus]